MSFEWTLFSQNDLVSRALQARKDELRAEDRDRNVDREEMARLIRANAATKLKINVLEARVVSQREEEDGKGGTYKRLNLEIDWPRGQSRLSQVVLRCAHHRKVGGGSSFSGFNWAIGRHIPLWTRLGNAALRFWNRDWAPPFKKRVEWLPFGNLAELGAIIEGERDFERFNVPDSAKFQGDNITWN